MMDKFKWIGVALFLLVLYRIDWKNFQLLLEQINWIVIAFCPLLFFLPVLLKSLRMQRILFIQDITIPYSWILICYIRSIFWGALTPGRVGELVKVHYLMGQGVGSGRATVNVFMDRFMDLIPLLLFALVAILNGVITFISTPWLILGWITAGFLTLLAYFWRSKIFQILQPVVKHLLPNYGKDTFLNFKSEFVDDLKKFNALQFILFLIGSTGIWLIYATPFLVLGFLGIGLDMKPEYLLVGIFLGTVVGLLPVSIAGVGTRDWFFIHFFGSVGVSQEQSVLFSFMYIYLYLFSILLGLLVGGRKLESTVPMGHKELK